MKGIDLYNEKVKEVASTTVVSGRYSFQKEAAKRIVLDVADKLKINPDDVVLDIGCNLGEITIPLSFFARR